jgi:hypothetical protein
MYVRVLTDRTGGRRGENKRQAEEGASETDGRGRGVDHYRAVVRAGAMQIMHCHSNAAGTGPFQEQLDAPNPLWPVHILFIPKYDV